jgi:LAS superfamily LD-carboxypeptidase LdcB
MSRTATARTTTRGTLGPTAVGLIVVTAAIIGTFIYRSASSSAPSFNEAPSPGAHRAVPQSASSSAPSFTEVPRVDHGRATTEDDGAVTEVDGTLPDGVTVFDDEYPGVANLDPDLLVALRRAATAAADDGVEFFVESGWRSPEYQERLLRQAISTYGSRKEAARWVATPQTSVHVTGDAIDIGHSDARAWLYRHGAEYGLCQTYRNEPWHYELRPEAIDQRCPSMYADPAHDPRLQQ